jgi:hypothetical protein
MRKRQAEVVFPNAAGIDVGASSHWVAVPRHATDDPVREFGTMTDDLQALADWLQQCGVDTVALESTGVYWIPLYDVLEQRSFEVWLVDARQMKYVRMRPGIPGLLAYSAGAGIFKSAGVSRCGSSASKSPGVVIVGRVSNR